MNESIHEHNIWSIYSLNEQYQQKEYQLSKNTAGVLIHHEDLPELCTSTVSIKHLRYKHYDVVFIVMERTL